MSLPDIISAVIDRLRSGTLGLRAVEGAAELAVLLESDKLPPQVPAAWVLPEGMNAAPVARGTGPHRQSVDIITGVVLCDRRQGDVTGGRTMAGMATLVDAVTTRLIGWTPAGARSALELRRGELTGLSAGHVFYALQFVCSATITRES